MIINQLLGPCKVDLFATRLNNQLQKYVSWHPDPFAMATNAFHLPWRNLRGYAFPPFALVGRVIQKVMEEAATIVLIAPVWPTQVWYPLLLEVNPILLPLAQDHLKDPFERNHPLMSTQSLQLAAWKVSGQVAAVRDFQRKLLSSSHRDGVKEQVQSTSQLGKNGLAGVNKGVMIHFRAGSVFSSISWQTSTDRVCSTGRSTQQDRLSP